MSKDVNTKYSSSMFTPESILPEILYIQNISNCTAAKLETSFLCALTEGDFFWANLKNVHWKPVCWITFKSHDLCCLLLVSSLSNEWESVAMSINRRPKFSLASEKCNNHIVFPEILSQMLRCFCSPFLPVAWHQFTSDHQETRHKHYFFIFKANLQKLALNSGIL